VRHAFLLLTAILTSAPALAQEMPSGSDARLPVSLDRIRAALARSPDKPLNLVLPKPNFRVEIRERQRFEQLLASLDFRSGPVPPGGLYGFEQRARLSPSPWGSQPIASVDLIAIGRLIGNALSNARRAQAEAAAREEVRKALDEFWAAQGKAPPPPPK
jgi:hypothetical protein